MLSAAILETLADLTESWGQMGTMTDSTPSSCRTPTGGIRGTVGRMPHPATTTTAARAPSTTLSILRDLTRIPVLTSELESTPVLACLASGLDLPHGEPAAGRSSLALANRLTFDPSGDTIPQTTSPASIGIPTSGTLSERPDRSATQTSPWLRATGHHRATVIWWSRPAHGGGA